MVIEKVHGLHATSLSLNQRFSLLASATPDFVAARPKRRPSVNSYFNQNMHFRNRNLVQQIARRLEFESKRQALRQRLGTLRRFGSETSLPGLRRSNSFGNLSQSSVKQRVQWRQSNGNLSRAASFDNLSQAWRGFRRRGGGARGLRGRFRGVQGFRGVRGVQGFRGARGVRGMRNTRGRGRGAGGPRGRAPMRARGRPRGGLRGRGRGRGGGMLRNQTSNAVPTKEELDDQLDRYMASTKAVLDKELDSYMKNAMDLE